MIFLGSIIECILLGGVISVVATALVYFLCRLISGSVTHLGAYVVLTILFVFAGAQGAMLSGAFVLKGYLDDVQETIETMVPAVDPGQLQALVPDSVQLNAHDLEQLREKLLDEYPMLRPLADKIDLQALADNTDLQTLNDYAAGGGTAIATQLTSQFNGQLNGYILRRLLWLLGMMAAATAAIVFFFSYRDTSHGSYDFGGSGTQAGTGLQF